MTEGVAVPTVLMSLREKYYNAMLSGQKKHEFRTRFLKTPSAAYIYISRTKKAIVAKINFGAPLIASSEEIAKISESENPGSYAGMMSYLHSGSGYAIPIESIEPLKEVSLDELRLEFPNLVVPQSYYILDKKSELLEFIKARGGVE